MPLRTSSGGAPLAAPHGYILGDSLVPALFQATTGLIAGHQNNNPVGWGLLNAGSRVRIDGNPSAAGVRSADVLSSQLGPALAAKPQVIFLMVGTNDTSLGLTLAQSIANFTAIFSALLAARIPVIVVNVPPNNNGFQVATGKLNAWLARYCRENPGVVLADVFSAVVDTTTGNYAAGMTSDGVHMSVLGAKTAGAVIAAAINAVFPVADVDLVAYNADANGLSNPLLITDTNADGVPDNWTTTGVGGTYALATDPAVLGKIFSLTRGANDITASSGQVVAAAGDRISLAMKARATVKAVAGSWQVNLICQTGGFVNLWAPIGTTSSTEDTPGAGFATIYGEGVIPAGQTGARAFVAVSGVANAKLEIAQITLRNMTALGIA